MKRFSKKEIFSIPNLMGYFRILMIPVFSWMYLTASTREDVYRAAAVVFISSVTDLLDGWVARRFHMVTELGKSVDPLADKLTHGALALCLAFEYPLMWALVALSGREGGVYGSYGTDPLKAGKEAGRRNVVRKGLHGPSICGNAGIIPVVRNAGGRCQRSDPVYDGSHGGSFAHVCASVQENEKRSIKTERKTAESAICRGSAVFHPIRELHFPGFPQRFSVRRGLILVQDLFLLYKGIWN